MGEKPSTDLAGIGEVLGKRLAQKGYDKVSCCCTTIVTVRVLMFLKFTNIGLRCPRSVLGAEEGRRTLHWVAKGRSSGQCEAGQGLLPVFDRMVRTIPLDSTPLTPSLFLLFGTSTSSFCFYIEDTFNSIYYNVNYSHVSNKWMTKCDSVRRRKTIHQDTIFAFVFTVLAVI